MKRILYVGNKLSSFGFTPTGIDYIGDLLIKNGFQVRFAGARKNKIMRLLSMIKKIIVYRNDYDVILIDTYSSFAFYYCVIAAWLARVFKKKYIPVLHGGNLSNRLNNSRWLTRQVIEHAYQVVSVSKYLQQIFSALRPIQYIPNSIDLTKYPFKQRNVLSPRLLWVRSFHKIYNPELAVRIVAALKTEYPSVMITMVGPDKDGSKDAVEYLANELGVTQNIRITGKLSKEDWITIAADHDIFINTTNFDNMPVSVVEAMALGLPIVSTNVGGVPFLIEHEINGLLVFKDDCDGFCREIKRLLTNEASVKDLIAKAHKFSEQFDSIIIGTRWQSLLN